MIGIVSLSSSGGADTPEFNTTTTMGTLTLHQVATVATYDTQGFIIIPLSLSREVEFIDQVRNSLIPGVKRLLDNPSTTSHRLSNYLYKVITNQFKVTAANLEQTVGRLQEVHKPGKFTGTGQQFSTERERRFLGIFSLGLGIANSAAIAALGVGQIADHQLLQKTTHKVEETFQLAAHNSKDIEKLYSEQGTLIRQMVQVESEVHANRISISLLAAVSAATDIARNIMNGIDVILRGEIPMSLFPVEVLSRAFEDFQALIRKSGFEVAGNPNAMSLYGSASHFGVITTAGGETVLNIVIPVPITSQRNAKWEVLKGETTLIQNQDTQGKNTIWKFAPRNLLLVQSIRDEEPRFAEVDSQYLATCIHNREILCPRIPSVTVPQSCLPHLFLKLPSNTCQSELTHWPSDVETEFQLEEHQIMTYSPQIRSAQVTCPNDTYTTVGLQGLQITELGPSCVFRLGGFTVVNAAQPVLQLPNKVRVSQEQEILQLLNMTMTSDWGATSIEKLAAEHRANSGQQRVTMALLDQLHSTKFPRWAEEHSTWVSWSTAAIVILVMVAILAALAWRAVRARGQRRQELPRGDMREAGWPAHVREAGGDQEDRLQQIINNLIA